MAGGVVAWENPSLGFFGQWWGTVKETFIPSRAFAARIAQSESAMPAATFSLSVFALLGLVFGVLMGVMYGAMGGMAALSGGKSAGPIGMLVASMGVGMAIAYPLMMAVSGFVGPWIGGGIHHLMLMMMGGATKSYSHTVRVSGYAAGAALWLLVPCVGSLAYVVVMVIHNILGLDETHRCGTGKAAAAVLLPIALLVVCWCASYGTIMALAMGSGGSRP
ncbi:MAG: hypothetical protein EON47_21175 [Acetobacteraceae bacterium]|nr:MAG: hypothetical protein EON47_21175 [Acetobacteraceae bacterium]